MQIVKPNIKIPFMSKRKAFLVFSAILMALSLGLVFTKGLNYGIDFKGGLELQYKFDSEVQVAKIRDALKDHGHGGAIVQKIEGTNTFEYLIAFELSEAGLQKKTDTITGLFKQAFPGQHAELRRLDHVGPRVGADLKKAAVLSVLYALLLILGYVWFRFDIAFSPAAVAALLHDVIITLGVLVLLNVEFGLAVVAAILTIVGYSLNDTIVIFDRIRDNVKQFGKLAFEKIIDRSVNECLSRTILTSLTTLFVVCMLIFFGGAALYPFALTLAIGIVVGTYSSIYIASPITLYIDQKLSERKHQKKFQTPNKKTKA